MLRGIFIISQICELLFLTESNNQSLNFLIHCMTFQGPWQHNVLTMALKYSYACDLPYKESFSVKIISKSANSIRTLERVRTKCLILTIAMHCIGLQVSTLLNQKNTALIQRILQLLSGWTTPMQ